MKRNAEDKIIDIIFSPNSGSPRTNNYVEGWHNKMTKNCGPHSNIYKFITSLKKEQIQQKLVMALIEAGTQHHPKNPKTRKHDEKLINIVKRFSDDIQDGNFLPYMHSIAHSLSF